MATQWKLGAAISLGLLIGCAGESEDLSSLPLVQAPVAPTGSSVVWFQGEDRKYGLRGKNGTIILPPTYDDVRPFSEGLAAVNVGAEWVFPGVPDGGKWGFVDESGELVIAIQFQYANRFSEGLAHVSNWSTGEGTMFIDPAGAVQIRIPDANAGDFRQGLAPVYRDCSLEDQGWLTEYIDPSGTVAFTVDGYGQEFFEGLAVLSVDDGTGSENRSYGYIDTAGKVVVAPRFGKALQFSGGLAAVRAGKSSTHGVGESWGYINRTGSFVIEPIYNAAKTFIDGKAMVHEGGEFILVADGHLHQETLARFPPWKFC